MQKKELLDGALEGNLDNIAELYNEYHDQLARFVKRINSKAGEDEVHQIMLQVLKLLKRGKAGFDDQWHKAFTVWLLRVARNVMKRPKEVISTTQSKQVHLETLKKEDMDFEMKSKHEGPHTMMIKTEIKEVMKNRIERLRPIFKEVIELRWYDGLSHRDIAQKLGATEEAIKQRLKKAYQILRSNVQNTFTTLSRGYQKVKEEIKV